MTFYAGGTNNTFTVSVASGAPATVNFYSDLGGNNLLSAIAPGASATFIAYGGFFYQATSEGSFTVSNASQGFQNSPILNDFRPVTPDQNVLTNSTLGLNTIYIRPFQCPASVGISRLNMYASIATVFSASNATGSGGFTLSAAIYSRLGTGSSDQIGTIWSGSQYLQFSNSSNSNLTFSSPTGLGSASTTFVTSNASTYMATNIGGYREFVFPATLTLAPGQYWFACGNSVASANASFSLGASVLQATYSNQIAYQPFGGASSASNASYPQFNEGLGSYSATSGAFPATVGLTGGQILNGITGINPVFNLSNWATNASEN